MIVEIGDVGLSLVSNVMRFHHGSLQVESRWRCRNPLLIYYRVASLLGLLIWSKCYKSAEENGEQRQGWLKKTLFGAGVSIENSLTNDQSSPYKGVYRQFCPHHIYRQLKKTAAEVMLAGVAQVFLSLRTCFLVILFSAGRSLGASQHITQQSLWPAL